MKPLREIPSGSFLADAPPGEDMARNQMNWFMSHCRPAFDSLVQLEEMVSTLIHIIQYDKHIPKELKDYMEAHGKKK